MSDAVTNTAQVLRTQIGNDASEWTSGPGVVTLLSAGEAELSSIGQFSSDAVARPDRVDPIVAFEGQLYDATGVGVAGSGRWGRAPRRGAAAIMSRVWHSHGIAAAHRLVGDFAIAVWDLSDAELTLLTDPFGLNPIYYAISKESDVLAFASDTRPLRRLDWVGSEPDDSTVVRFLLDRAWELDHSFYKNIRLLPAGHSLTWRRGQRLPTVARYWGPTFRRTGISSKGQFLDAFEDCFRTAVAQRLCVSEPTAILMSGGLDSTAVAGVAARIAREYPNEFPPIQVVSGVFPGMECDESERIKSALRTNGLPGQLVRAPIDGISIESIKREVSWHDMPFINLQRPVMHLEYATAKRVGAKRIMTGVGGDELTTDYGYAIDLLRTRGLRHLPSISWLVSRTEGMGLFSAMMRLLRQSAPEQARLIARATRDGLRSMLKADGSYWLSPSARKIASSPALTSPPPSLRSGSVTLDGHWESLAGNAYLQFAHRWWGRDASMFDLHCVHPFLDRRLFELVFGTDPSFMPRTGERGELKPLIAQGLSGYLATEIVTDYRFIVFDCYMASTLANGVPEIIEWLSDSPHAADHPYFDPRTVTSLAKAASAGKYSDRKSVSRLLRLRNMLGVEAWLEVL